MQEEKFLRVAVGAAKIAGKFLTSNFGKLRVKDAKRKLSFDFVTEIDKEAEEIIVNEIRKSFPEHGFFGEETHKDREMEYIWIIDPLDGTTNYIHSYPMFSLSIALAYKGELIVGVIFDPLRDELFTAIKGKGAYLNNRRIKVNEAARIETSLIATGFPFRSKEYIDSYLKAFREIFLKAGAIRRAGSAALDLAYVACSRCDGFFEFGLSPWDIAAGSLLIKEAGGMVSDFSGGDRYMETGNIVAGAENIHREILNAVRRAFR